MLSHELPVAARRVSTTMDGAIPGGRRIAAAAAVLFATAPSLTNSQATTLLEHSADDVNAATGCARCSLLRDSLSGWGRLDVAKALAALASPLPTPDRFETNDDAGTQAFTLWGKQRKLTATVDYYDDPVDVYRIVLTGRERLTAKLAGGWSGANVSLVLWRPRTRRIDASARTLRAAQAIAPGSRQHLAFTAPSYAPALRACLGVALYAVVAVMRYPE